MKCKNGKEDCGVHWDCGACSREQQARSFRRLTPEQKAYDRYVDPRGAYHTDFPDCCSCHINAPCGYCVGRE